MKMAPLSKNKKRSAARIGAVQTLYASHINNQNIVKNMADFLKSGGVVEMDGGTYPANQQLYTQIVHGVLNRNDHIIDLANATMEKRPLERQNPLIQFIIKAGIFEFLENHTADNTLIISEYVDIAHAFFEPKEAGLVNGVLNTVCKNLG